jgi:hypothetical protein
MITAIEALKLDKTLWREVMQGGFNTLDNFLFTIQDFLYPSQSALFNRLYKLNSSPLNFYLETLKWLCNSEYSVIPPPSLFENSAKNSKSIPSQHQQYAPNIQSINRTVSANKYKIITTEGSASVLTSTFQYLGSTPLELDKQIYKGKLILISNGRDTKQITLNDINIVEINFS